MRNPESRDVTGEPREYSRKESPLKYQSRCISCFTDNTGFAVGSIEGRVGIHYLQKVAGKDSFAFKCHRQDSNVYAVNAICFQTQFGTFATCGSDGIINFWDKDNSKFILISFQGDKTPASYISRTPPNLCPSEHVPFSGILAV